MSEKIVLFICVENSCRSLMAEAMFNASPPHEWKAISAGTEPARVPNARTAKMLQEIGLEIPAHPPQLMTPEMMTRSAVRVTMGCLDSASCPAKLKTMEVTDWGLPDPAQLDDAGFRQVREGLRQRVEGLVRDLTLRNKLQP
jgi:arsenate reductase